MSIASKRSILAGTAVSLIPSILFVSFSATPAAAWSWGYESGLRYAEPYTPGTRTTDVATFPDGTTIVVGFIEHDQDEFDWVLARIGNEGSANGNLGYTEHWRHELGSAQEPTADQAERVATDPDGNAFVGGQMWDASGSVYRSRIVKLDGVTGNVISSVFFPKPVSSFSDRYIRDLAVDSAGDLVVAFGSSSGLFRIVKLDGSDLTQTLWTYTTSGAATGESFDVVLDGSDDVFVAGTLDVAGGTLRAIVAKLDGDTGGELWKNDTVSSGGRVWHGPNCPTPLQAPSVPSCGSGAATSLLVTSSGDAVVLAEQADGTSSLVARLAASDGSVVWQRPLPDFVPRSITSDYLTSVYVAGAAGISHDQFAIAAIDLATGDVSWSETYGAGYAKDIDVTGDGKPTATGSVQDLAGDYRFTVISALAADGTEAWRTIDEYGIEGHGFCIAQTPEGHLVAGGVEVGAICPGCAGGDPTIYHLSYLVAWRLLSGDGSLIECGNGAPEDGEGCDDGNFVSGDCCSSTCELEPTGSPCDDGLACSTVDECDQYGDCQPIDGDCCGDGTIQPTLGEDCEFSGSCCVACHVSYGASCDYGTTGNPFYLGPGQHPACNPPRCGFRGGCYDGPSTCDCCSAHDGYGCTDAACQQCVTDVGGETHCATDSWDFPCAARARDPLYCDDICNCPPVVCGNNVVEPGEQCDDGNTTSGDCCSSTCQDEGSCPVCGNGIINFPGEDCDDGNTTSGDCCDSTCQVEPACCGNGTVNDGELCDDGNTVSGDCCSSTCSTEFTCCGDYYITAGEECDDGNSTSGDCCSSSCEFESQCSEHFKAYKSKTTPGTTKFSPEQITLEDAFGTHTIAVSKPSTLANPVSKNAEAIVDATMHLECYKTKDISSSQPSPTFVSVAAKGSTEYVSVQLKKASSLCMPTAKNGVPSNLGADRFRCYKAKAAKLDTTVTLADQFETKITAIGSPSLLCNPAQPTLATVQQPDRHLLCYKIKDAKTEPKQPKLAPQSVTTENSFGNESLTASKSSLLCVPALLFP